VTSASLPAVLAELGVTLNAEACEALAQDLESEDPTAHRSGRLAAARLVRKIGSAL